uniref:HMA domain-containing protein n=2 Tax=Kalanchoe fedtschenkoi TaxID=63787 RepID=A0A7N0V5I7_KALFE
MGELKPEVQQDTKKPDSAGKNEDAVNVVLKLDMHCSGCVKKLKKFVRGIDGVAVVKVDFDSNKLTVTGKVDPSKLRELLASKTNKKVELISPQPKKPDPVVAVEKQAEKPAPPPEKPKEAEEAPKPKSQAPPSTVVLKTKLHCDGCSHKIRKIVARFKGVQDVTIDGARDLITVTGTVDVTEMIPYLVEKLRRNVELVPTAKRDESGDKKTAPAAAAVSAADGGDEKKNAAAGEEKKGKEKGGDEETKKKDEEGGEVVKVEAQRMVYQYQPNYGGYNYNSPGAGPSTTYWYGGGGGGYGQDNRMWSQGYDGGRAAAEERRNVGYVIEHFQYPNHHAPPYEEPGMFSDENPNACSVM